MIQGTTPTFVITIPADYSVSNIDTAYFSFSQNDEVLIEKELANMTVNTTDNTLAVTLTQAETFTLTALKSVYYQLRFKIGTAAYATEIFAEAVKEALKSGEI